MSYQGNNIDNALVEDLKRKIPQGLNKDEIISLIGSESFSSFYDPNACYYVYRVMQNKTWLKPSVVEQKIIMVAFDSNNKVKNIDVLKDILPIEIVIDKERTLPQNNDYNYWKHLVNNIGKFGQYKNKSKPQTE